MNEGSMKITSAQLQRLGACEKQVKLFEELFGSEVELTLEICLQHAHQFNFDWVANKMLSPAAYAEYVRVNAPALAEYKKVRVTARAEYEKVEEPAWAEYEKVKAPALAEYEKVKAPALAEYEKVKVTAFYQGLLSSKKGG